jgi:predicted nuclease with RNAse H fold
LKILGFDLAGKSKNPAFICILNDNKIEFITAYSDKQILEISIIFKPDIIAIDAPIMQGKPKIRKADKILKKYGAFPPSLTGMNSLTLRGSKLAKQLRTKYMVIEVFPTATAKILKKFNRNYKETAMNLGIKVKNKHEIDAYLCCLTAKMYLKGKTLEIGDEAGKIIIPK